MFLQKFMGPYKTAQNVAVAAPTLVPQQKSAEVEKPCVPRRFSTVALFYCGTAVEEEFDGYFQYLNPTIRTNQVQDISRFTLHYYKFNQDLFIV